MPYKPRSTYHNYIRRLCDEFRSIMFCGEYNLHLAWEMEPGEVQKGAAAAMRSDPTYLECTIFIGPECKEHWKRKEYEDIARIILHEFAHLVTEPLYLIGLDAVTNTSKQFLEDVRERQTSRIANIVFEQLDPKVWKP